MTDGTEWIEAYLKRRRRCLERVRLNCRQIAVVGSAFCRDCREREI